MQKPAEAGSGGVMQNWQWAVLLKPFLFLALAVGVLIPARLAVRRYMRDGKLKRLLLTRVGP
jgi:hypothetical protein